MHSLWGLFVHSAHQLEQQPLLDDIMTIHRWCNAFHQPRIYMIGIDHLLQLLELWFSKRLSERPSIIIPVFLLTTNVSAALWCMFRVKRTKVVNRPHPIIRIMRHTCKEGGLVLEISDTKTL